MNTRYTIEEVDDILRANNISIGMVGTPESTVFFEREH